MLKELVEESAVARSVIAKDADLSYAALHSWLVGARTPRPESLRQLAAGFRVRADLIRDLADRIDQAAEEL